MDKAYHFAMRSGEWQSGPWPALGQKRTCAGQL